MTTKRDDDNEMSMEEILASIRRYVSDETENTSTGKGSTGKIEPSSAEGYYRPQSMSAPSDRNERQGPSSYESPFDFHSTPDNSPPEVIHLTEAFEVLSAATSHTAPIAAEYPADYENPAAFAYTAEPSTASVSTSSFEKEEALLSASSRSASSQAFSRLMESLAPSAPAQTAKENPASMHTGMTLDHLFAELARPMIKQWLDQNLPPMVEGLVNKEIERLTQHLRHR